jgi:hypothetical protein
MKQRTDGDFDVAPGEKITITVQRDSPPCVATFAPAKGCLCGSVLQPEPRTMAKTCSAPPAVGVQWDQTIIFGFPTNPAGGAPNTHYLVTIQGDAGGPPVPDDVNAPPDPRDRTYTFHVSAQ